MQLHLVYKFLNFLFPGINHEEFIYFFLKRFLLPVARIQCTRCNPMTPEFLDHPVEKKYYWKIAQRKKFN